MQINRRSILTGAPLAAAALAVPAAAQAPKLVFPIAQTTSPIAATVGKPAPGSASITDPTQRSPGLTLACMAVAACGSRSIDANVNAALLSPLS